MPRLVNDVLGAEGLTLRAGTVVATAADVNDLNMAGLLLRVDGEEAFGDAGHAPRQAHDTQPLHRA